MRLVACSSCHTQYDVTNVAEKEFDCRCGERVENRDLTAVDALIHRCGSCGAQVGADAESCDYCGSAIVRDDASLSLICPECFGRNEEAARFCTACGVSFSPQSVVVEGNELPCPCCTVLMPVRQVGGLGLNECPQCNGLWVPEQRLEQLIARAIEARRDRPEALAGLTPRVKGANPAQQQVAYRKCPVCEAFMARRNFQRSSGVIIDTCGDHGTWLDADELERIAGFLVSGGKPVSTANLERESQGAKEALARARVAQIAAQQGSRRTRRDRDDSVLEIGGGVVGTIFKVFDALLS